MLRGFFLIALVMAAALAGGGWFLTDAVPPFGPKDRRFDGAGDPENGRLVFAAGDCASCHAEPGQFDRLRLGGGMALGSPFGTMRVPNISSDSKDGIGAWSARDLANALVGGVSPRGQHYYPGFPYTSFTAMKDKDIIDLMAYLKTLPAVTGRAPDHDLVLLFRYRRFVGIWKLLFFREGRATAQLNNTGVKERGAYLAEALSHCAECHSSRNILGGVRSETLFAGGTDPSGTGFVPNITPAAIGRWTESEIAEILKTGITPDHGRVGSSMSEVVTNTALLSQPDRDAIARYIKNLPSRPTPQP